MTSPGSSSTSRTSIWRSPSNCVTARPRLCVCLTGSGHLVAVSDAVGIRVTCVRRGPLTGLALRQGPAEEGPRRLARLGVEPEPTPVVLHDLLAHRQADAGATVGIPAVQALEDHEDLVLVLLVDADAVVAAGELPDVRVPGRTSGRDVHPRRVLPPELHTVGDEILQQLDEKAVVTLDRGQRVMGHHRIGLG